MPGLHSRGVHRALVIFVLMGGQWPAVEPLASPGSSLSPRTGKNVVVWYGARKPMVWVWKPSVNLAVLFHLHKSL